MPQLRKFVVTLYRFQVKFRNKIGIDVCSEIIGNYLERPNRNLSKLMDYARKLRVGTILEKYLQMKL